jgi:hypothetical protein
VTIIDLSLYNSLYPGVPASEKVELLEEDVSRVSRQNSEQPALVDEPIQGHVEILRELFVPVIEVGREGRA